MLLVHVRSFRFIGSNMPVVAWQGSVDKRWHATVAQGIAPELTTAEILRCAGLDEGDYVPGCLHMCRVNQCDHESVSVHAASIPYLTPRHANTISANRCGVLDACRSLCEASFGRNTDSSDMTESAAP